MGIILSKFRKEKSTAAVLEGLQEQIQELEQYLKNTQERKRRFVSNFLGVTIGIYIVGFVLWYFFYFPPTVKERLMNLVPLLIFPVLIIFLRQIFTWYFQRKLNKNGNKLAELKVKKSQILDQVMDKEIYKDAVKLLERFGDKKLNPITSQLSATPRPSQSITALNRSASNQIPRTPIAAPGARQQRSLTPYTSVYRNQNNNLNTSLSSNVQRLQVMPATPVTRAGQELRRRTPFPIVDERSRSALDRIVDMIVGDSPQDRFGMICKKCHSHNGMLPKEEYEYTTFRCAFCEELNPARKERPVAPRLALQQLPETPNTPLSARNESSDSGSSADEDSDREEPTRSEQLQALQPTDITETTTTPTTTASSHESETDVAAEPEANAAAASESTPE
ncbi:endoplasmic reticulum junction formation protein lunapark-A [Scaptodrosophila lebanonensis]|uniref:Endoplasmic reticulum junction formation protein lunapark n=1 Tax=Drosophila lebanonensis TaxID=7225 RepID=A0A6J2UF08_DROLE|nr:endoplasmic reticulum junction formation protein lunapark-A [Scaptodrosophila lebanonensis]